MGKKIQNEISQVCPACEGSGKNILKCSLCHGIGRRIEMRNVIGPPEMVTVLEGVWVPGFMGKPGRREMRPKTTLKPGKVIPKQVEVTCTACGGMGKKEVKCPKCNGSGKKIQ
jgi:DnaJ-class molecular chaperone